MTILNYKSSKQIRKWEILSQGINQEDTGFKATADVLHLDSASKIVSKANFYIIKKREKAAGLCEMLSQHQPQYWLLKYLMLIWWM